jgi:hypothetical protein
MAIPIKIENADIQGEGGSITNATITGDATIQQDPNAPHPSHPILLPPTSDNPDVFFILSFCANPPPPHWEWIAFMPGSPPERPTPKPPPEIPTIPSEPKPPPADGGWGWFPGYGWVFYPGPGAPGPKKR